MFFECSECHITVWYNAFIYDIVMTVKVQYVMQHIKGSVHIISFHFGCLISQAMSPQLKTEGNVDPGFCLKFCITI